MYRLHLLLLLSFQLTIAYSQKSVPISDSILVDTLTPLLEMINEYKLIPLGKIVDSEKEVIQYDKFF